MESGYRREKRGIKRSKSKWFSFLAETRNPERQGDGEEQGRGHRET